ncbi:MAG: DUF2190 family protein [Acetobacteraceae bacterium]|nr:DUF2190 family protein [Acetobacteraceae bacterium]
MRRAGQAGISGGPQRPLVRSAPARATHLGQRPPCRANRPDTGARVFRDNTNRRITNTAAGNFQVGIASPAALAADTTVRACLNRMPALGT